MLFLDRSQAGQKLANLLRGEYAGRDDVLILALPRGGVPVAAEVARALKAPLDILAVRKLGVPRLPELAFGAITPGGEVRVLDEGVIRAMRIPPEAVERTAAREMQEAQRQERRYRGADRPPPVVGGQTVIVVDDGAATGTTMAAGLVLLRAWKPPPARLIAAVPVASREACTRLTAEADAFVCCEAPEEFNAVGFWYSDFHTVSDQEVCRLLQRAAAGRHPEKGAQG